MYYKEAFAIGSVIEGTIKCTFAEVYDSAGQKLFSFQNKNFSRDIIAPDTSNRYDRHDEGSVKNDNFYLNLAWTSERVFEAVVTADQYMYDYKVPVQLNSNATALIQKTLELRIEKYNAFLEKYDGQYDSLTPRMKSVVDAQRSYMMETQRKLDLLMGNGLYVKPKAFDWHPLNTRTIDSEYNEAKRKYEQAKTIMAVSAASIII